MTIKARITGYDGQTLTIAPEGPILPELMRKSINTVELRLDDGRSISAAQRRRIFATVRDIAEWSGDEPEYIRQCLSWDFRSIDGREAFSLSNVDMTTAREFLSYLIDFCFRWSVPTREPLLSRADDTDRYLYMCLWHRKCAVCNDPAQVHHVDAVGMGRSREELSHQGMRAIALCPTHHREAHAQPGFLARHHVYGIPLDKALCRRLGLGHKEF